MALMGAGWFGFVSDDVVCLLSYNLLGMDWDVMCFIRLLLASQAVCMFVLVVLRVRWNGF